MTMDFAQALDERLSGGASPVVIGLDPRLDALPAGLDGSETERIVAFYRETLPVLAEKAAVVKPNIAFFEAFGSAGYQAYEATCALARKLGLLVIGDIKRGDIGSTAAAYAVEHFRHAHALTLHPYLGHDAIRPFLDRCRDGENRGVFVLVRTSNPGAADFQDLDTGGGRRLCDAVATAVHEWGGDLGDPGGYSPVGAVVGATWPEDIARLRELMPRAWFLLPGVGAQGGSVQDVRAAFDSRGRGALINQSRGVMQCFDPGDGDWLAKIGAAVDAFTSSTAEAAGL